MPEMRIVVTGRTGQVATALTRVSRPGVELVVLGRPELDLASPPTVFNALQIAMPDLVVSSAAYTAVDTAETEIDLAFLVNRNGARAVAEAAAALDIPVIHLSTDYVFDGLKSTPYIEDDRTGPMSVYGRSKLEGEMAVKAATSNHAIVRTAWVYSPYGHNFVKTMLRLAETRNEISVVADQVGCPTSADDMALAIIEMALRMHSDPSAELRGTFHLVGNGETSWAGFARHIFAILEEKTGRQINVRDIPSAHYSTPAKRPMNSRLDCSKLQRVFGIRLPGWKTSAERTVRRLLKESGQ